MTLASSLSAWGCTPSDPMGPDHLLLGVNWEQWRLSQGSQGPGLEWPPKKAPSILASSTPSVTTALSLEPMFCLAFFYCLHICITLCALYIPWWMLHLFITHAVCVCVSGTLDVSLHMPLLPFFVCLFYAWVPYFMKKIQLFLFGRFVLNLSVVSIPSLLH